MKLKVIARLKGKMSKDGQEREFIREIWSDGSISWVF